MTTIQRVILLVLFVATVGIFIGLGSMLLSDLGVSASTEIQNPNPQLPTSNSQLPTVEAISKLPTTTPSLSEPPTAGSQSLADPQSGATGTTANRQPPATRTPTITDTPEPTLTPTLIPPPSAKITDILGHRQSLPLSCESRSATDWAGYFGVKIDELQFLHSLPPSDNPERGFVGSVTGAWGQIPPEPYGVHAAPVATLLRAHGLKARAYHDLTWDQVRAEIAAGEPVIIWIVGHVEPGTSITYTTPNGLEVIVAQYEHTAIAIGYTEDSLTVLDGAKIYSRPLSVFLNSWAALGNMGIILEN